MLLNLYARLMLMYILYQFVFPGPLVTLLFTVLRSVMWFCVAVVCMLDWFSAGVAAWHGSVVSRPPRHSHVGYNWHHSVLWLLYRLSCHWGPWQSPSCSGSVILLCLFFSLVLSGSLFMWKYKPFLATFSMSVCIMSGQHVSLKIGIDGPPRFLTEGHKRRLVQS